MALAFPPRILATYASLHASDKVTNKNGGTMQISFEEKVVLIAGGTGGLGRSVALAFLNERAKVAVTYRSEEEFAALKSAAGESAKLLTGHSVDVTDES